MASPNESAKFRLCLHFDINKSIIMTDAVSGRSMDQTLSSLLTECTWGKCEEKPMSERSAADWVICHPVPTTSPPIVGSITLSTYLEDYTEVDKAEQRRIKRGFTDSGGMGHCFLPYQEQLAEALKFEGVTRTDKQPDYLSAGCYHIIPSFFRLVEFLAEKNINFNILFRTFGNDITNVCEEFNMFCAGQHPAYLPSRKLDGTDPRYPHDLRIQLPHYHGIVTHTGPGSEGLHMTYTEKDMRKCTATGSAAVFDVIMRDWFGICYTTSDTSSNATSAETTNAPTCSTTTVSTTLCAALQDDFHWWHTINDESDESGKLLLVDCNHNAKSASNERVIQVFFDDNIERDRAHIVAVHDCLTYAPIPFTESQGKFLRRVEPYEAILDREYYVKEVLDALRQHGVEFDV